MSAKYVKVKAAEPAPSGTVLELLQRSRKEQQQRAQRAVAARATAPQALKTANPSRRLFLVEFACLGDVRTACDASDCTVYDVRHWRTSDAMFRRDFALAALAHVRELKRMVQAVANDVVNVSSDEARQLLVSESRYFDADDRLDVRGWRDALWDFLRKVGIDPTTWEPDSSAA